MGSIVKTIMPKKSINIDRYFENIYRIEYMLDISLKILWMFMGLIFTKVI